MVRDSNMYHILHHFEKQLCAIRFCIIIRTAFSIDVSNLLIIPSFGSSDFSDAFKQVIKVVLAEMTSLLQTIIIQNVAFDEKLFQDRCCPYPELRGLIAVDPSDSSPLSNICFR